MKETKDIRYFEESMQAMIDMQNHRRDLILDDVLKEKFTNARARLQNMETLATAIDLCRQTIQRHIKQQEELNKALQATAIEAQQSNKEVKS